MRAAQKETQQRTGKQDQGTRSAVTGGKQLDGLASLFCEFITDQGLPETTIHRRETTLPGFFRPTKDWDIVVVVDNRLVATLELKSQVGPSFGNNFNNRVEEAIGSGTDFQTAFREGAFRPSPKPWLG